jgi:hypothetical protein
MTTNQNTSKTQRIRSSLRHMWRDQVNANRSLLRPPVYDDYLQNRRNLD